MGGPHRVDLVWRDGREERVAVPEDEPILEAAERTSIALPFGCKTGACATCTGKLLAGDVVHLRKPRALKERHLRDGYVLTCIAAPTEPCRIEVGKAVQADLVENPWK